MTAPALELVFANQDALADYLRIPEYEQSRYLPATTDSLRDTSTKQHALTRRLETSLAASPPPELQRVLLASTPAVGSVVAIEQAFYFGRIQHTEFVRLFGEVNTDGEWRVEGRIDKRRFPFASTAGLLSGRRRVFLVGTVLACDDGMIEVRPLFIGQRRWDDAPETADTDPRRVHAQDVDHFAGVDWSRPPTKPDMAKMNSMAESDVKGALARIIGTPFVDKDWGGERSDLVTNDLLVRTTQTSAAWLLKGRSVQGPMRIPHLGKNGDQIERLSTEPVELLVIQHNNAITSPVVNLVRAFAYDMRAPRRYMILDGQQSAMVLKHFGALG